MAIVATENTKYNPDTGAVNEKYTPLSGVKIDWTSNRAEINNIVDERIKLVANLTGSTISHGVTLQTLNLNIRYYGIGINQIIDDEVQKVKTAGESVPPLVVCSSNRSAWIKACFDRGNAIIAAGGFVPNSGISDDKILQNGAVPIYFPQRLDLIKGQNRSVYIFVNINEYEHYRKTLDTLPGIKVIGWDFPNAQKLSGMSISCSMFGFGVTRYAAMEFFKAINKQASASPISSPEVFNKIWMVDDNVAFLLGGQGLPDFEKRMKPGSKGAQIAGLGFKGANEFMDDFKNLSKKKLVYNPNYNPYLLQQMVLWNVAYLNQYKYDFSSCFITAAEDIGITQYTLKYDQNTCEYDQNFQLLKAEVKLNDNTNDYKSYESFKINFLSSLSIHEIRTLINNKGTDQDLGIVLQNIFGKSLKEPQCKTISKAIEQILRTGIKDDTLSSNTLPPYDPMFMMQATVDLQNT